MALYECRICGTDEVTKQDVLLHQKREHGLKKGQKTVIDVLYVLRSGGYAPRREQKFWIIP